MWGENVSFSYKQVGNLVFNQAEGLIKHKATNEDLARYLVKIAIPVHLLAKGVDVPIDSTGVKEDCGHFELPGEAVKHLSSAYLEAAAASPSATDASVDVELYNASDGAVVAKVTFSGEGGFKKSGDIASDLKALGGKVLSGRINVTTASATSGATQTFQSIVLVLIYDLTK